MSERVGFRTKSTLFLSAKGNVAVQCTILVYPDLKSRNGDYADHFLESKPLNGNNRITHSPSLQSRRNAHALVLIP